MTNDLLPCPFCATVAETPFENLRDSEDTEEIIKVWTMHHHCRGIDIWVEGGDAGECASNWNKRWNDSRCCRGLAPSFECRCEIERLQALVPVYLGGTRI